MSHNEKSCINCGEDRSAEAICGEFLAEDDMIPKTCTKPAGQCHEHRASDKDLPGPLYEGEMPTRRILEKHFGVSQKCVTAAHEIAVLWTPEPRPNEVTDECQHCEHYGDLQRDYITDTMRLQGEIKALRPSDDPPEVCGATFDDESGPTCTLPKGHDLHSCEMTEEEAVNDYEKDVPITEDFLAGVKAEKEHQLKRWGTTHDRNKAPADWFWLLGYLSGKALAAAVKGDREKALHHCISSAAVLANWHDAIRSGGPSLKVEHDPSKALYENNPDPSRASDLEKHLGSGQ